MLRKTAVLSLIVLLVLTLVAGCTQSTDTPTAAPTATKAADTATKAPSVTEPPESGELRGPLQLRLHYHSLIEQIASEGIDYNENRLVQAHEKNSGIDLELVPPLADGTQEMQKRAMILTSKDTPDMMNMGFSEYVDYALQGALLETDGYFASMPDFMSLVPDVAREALKVNGKTYCFMGSHEELDMLNTGGSILYRKDVFDTMGMEIPRTLDQLTEVFRAVKQQKNMIPLTFTETGPFKTAFGVMSTTREVDGKYVYTWTLPEYKEYLEYMHMLYEEQLWDNEYLTMKTADMQEKMVTGQAFSLAVGWAAPCVTINGIWDKIPEAEYAYFPLPVKNEGDVIYGLENFPSQRIMAVPAFAKNPDLAAEFYNYMCTPEAKLIQDYGIEGTDYRMKDGKIDQTLEEQLAVGWKICYEMVPTEASFRVRLIAKGYDWARDLQLESQAHVTPARDIVTFIPPSEEFNKLSQQLAIKTYADEQFTKFITGDRPLSEWDAFIGELEARGLAQLHEGLNKWISSSSN